MAPKKVALANSQGGVLAKVTKTQSKQKKPKVVVKNTLDNPFTLDFPVIDEELENSIISQVKLCFAGLKTPVLKPPWREVRKLKRKDRLQHCQEFKKKTLVELNDNPNAAETQEARSNLIFGYNAVMRALEQNKLAGILVKRDTHPMLLAQMYLPACIHKRIPLVSIVGLDDILRGEDMLAVKHSIIVIGFKHTVQESNNRFFPLYKDMLKVLECMKNAHQVLKVEMGVECEGDLMMSTDKEICGVSSQSEEISGSDDKENVNRNQEEMEVFKKECELTTGSGNVDLNVKVENASHTNESHGYKLTPEAIALYHLPRLDSSKRVFIPEKKECEIIDPNFIAVPTFRCSGAQPPPPKRLKPGKPLDYGHPNKDKSKMKKNPTKPQTADFSFGFYLDTAGDEDLMADANEEVINKNGKCLIEKEDTTIKKKRKKVVIKKKKKKVAVVKESGGNEGLLVDASEEVNNKNRKCLIKKKKKVTVNKESLVALSYTSAKIKRVKNNPDRKISKNKNKGPK